MKSISSKCQFWKYTDQRESDTCKKIKRNIGRKAPRAGTKEETKSVKERNHRELGQEPRGVSEEKAGGDKSPGPSTGNKREEGWGKCFGKDYRKQRHRGQIKSSKKGGKRGGGASGAAVKGSKGEPKRGGEKRKSPGVVAETEREKPKTVLNGYPVATSTKHAQINTKKNEEVANGGGLK